MVVSPILYVFTMVPFSKVTSPVATFPAQLSSNSLLIGKVRVLSPVPFSILSNIASDRGGMDNREIWVDSSAIIGNISHISFVSISMVVDMLGTAIRKSNRVRSSSVTSTITSLSSVEVGLGVVISNSIGVSVRRGLIRVSNGSMDNRCMVSRGCMDKRGMVSGSGMDYWGMVDRRSMVGRAMTKNSPSSMKTVRRVSNGSNTSSESLGLNGASMLSLEWLGH